MYRIKKSLRGLINYIKLVFSLYNVCGDNSPELVLKVIKIFIALESPFYKNIIYHGRNLTDSSNLLQSLIDSYLTTKSEVTLDQILEVLKEEFIRREEHGRKQF